MFGRVDESVLDIELTVQSEKSIDHLHNQLNKLIDVDGISVKKSDALQCPT